MAQTSSALIIVPMETDSMPYIKGGEAQSALAWASSSPCSFAQHLSQPGLRVLVRFFVFRNKTLNHVLLSYSLCVGHSGSV